MHPISRHPLPEILCADMSPAAGLQMSIRDEDTLPLSLPPQQRDSISRPSMTGDVGPTGTTASQPPSASGLHRDDSARATKGATSTQ